MSLAMNLIQEIEAKLTATQAKINVGFAEYLCWKLAFCFKPADFASSIAQRTENVFDRYEHGDALRVSKTLGFDPHTHQSLEDHIYATGHRRMLCHHLRRILVNDNPKECLPSKNDKGQFYSKIVQESKLVKQQSLRNWPETDEGRTVYVQQLAAEVVKHQRDTNWWAREGK
eukprot:m.4235 g.4235  ORF g.4235 m.4235 type:complete len:172 (-) comp4941_c0_seq1:2-517(-)